MVKFLTTTGVNYQLEQLIKSAGDKLYLVSPYLKVNNILRRELADIDIKKIDLRIVYGKAELQSEESTWLNSLASLRLSYCKDLHAKCFMNESAAILTSMNLYEFSQVNNLEMGVLVTRDQDPDIYQEIAEYVMQLIRMSEEQRVTVEKVTKPDRKKSSTSGATKKTASDKPTTGFCIRCATEIKANPLRPYCRDCYEVWSQYANPDYEDKHCHLCGKENLSTLNKPTCYSCYRKHRNDFEFALNG